MVDSLVENYPMTSVHRIGPDIIESAGAPERALSARRGAESTRRVPVRTGRATSPERVVVSGHQCGLTTLFTSSGREMTSQNGSQGEIPVRISRQSLVREDFTLSPVRGNDAGMFELSIRSHTPTFGTQTVECQPNNGMCPNVYPTIGGFSLVVSILSALTRKRSVVKEKGTFQRNLRKVIRSWQRSDSCMNNVASSAKCAALTVGASKERNRVKNRTRRQKKILRKQRKQEEVRRAARSFETSIQEHVESMSMSGMLMGNGVHCRQCEHPVHGAVFVGSQGTCYHFGCRENRTWTGKEMLDICGMQEFQDMWTLNGRGSQRAVWEKHVGFENPKNKPAHRKRQHAWKHDGNEHRKRPIIICKPLSTTNMSYITKSVSASSQSSHPLGQTPAWPKIQKYQGCFHSREVYKMEMHLRDRNLQSCLSNSVKRRPSADQTRLQIYRRKRLRLAEPTFRIPDRRNKCVQNCILSLARTVKERKIWRTMLYRGCLNDECSCEVGTVAEKQNLDIVREMLSQARCCVRIVHLPQTHSWETTKLLNEYSLGWSKGHVLGWLCWDAQSQHVQIIEGLPKTWNATIERVIPAKGKLSKQIKARGGQPWLDKLRTNPYEENIAHSNERLPRSFRVGGKQTCAAGFITSGRRDDNRKDERSCPAAVTQNSHMVYRAESIGLWNGDQRCYMNAVLQSLQGCRHFTACIQSMSDQYQEMSKDLVAQEIFLSQLTGSRLTVKRDTEKILSRIRTQYPEVPIPWFHRLLLLSNLMFQTSILKNRTCMKLSALPAEMHRGDQMDAQEFLANCLHCEGSDDSSLSQLFQFRCCKYYKCTRGECGHVQTALTSQTGQVEEFRILQLHIEHAGQEFKDVETCIKFFEAPIQEEDKDTKFVCQACHSKELPIKRTKITSLPSILVLHLNRYVFDPISLTYSKRSNTVRTPSQLEISEVSYTLKAVVYHGGSSLDSGHYWAYINQGTSKRQEWYLYNDNVCRFAKGAEPFSTEVEYENATMYLLFYEKQFMGEHCLSTNEARTAFSDCELVSYSHQVGFTRSDAGRPLMSDAGEPNEEDLHGERVKRARHELSTISHSHSSVSRGDDKEGCLANVNSDGRAYNVTKNATEHKDNRSEARVGERIDDKDNGATCSEKSVAVLRRTLLEKQIQGKDGSARSAEKAIAPNLKSQMPAQGMCLALSIQAQVEDMTTGTDQVAIQGTANSCGERTGKHTIPTPPPPSPQFLPFEFQRRRKKTRYSVHVCDTAFDTSETQYGTAEKVVSMEQKFGHDHHNATMTYQLETEEIGITPTVGNVKRRPQASEQFNAQAKSKAAVEDDEAAAKHYYQDPGVDCRAQQPPFKQYKRADNEERKTRCWTGTVLPSITDDGTCLDSSSRKDDVNTLDNGDRGNQKTNMERTCACSGPEITTGNEVMKLLTTRFQVEEQTETGEDAPKEEHEDEAPETLRQVKVTDLQHSPHPRAKLELALQTLAEQIRREPTIPAHPNRPGEPMPEALRQDVAVELPLKHCAFEGCSWNGKTNLEREKHLKDKHDEALKPVMAKLPSHQPEDVRRSSAYAEAIAIRIRQGAPTSTYSLHRRAVQKYTAAASGNNISQPICFCCACKFPHVEGRETNLISWHKPFVAADLRPERIVKFVEMQCMDVKSALSLEQYLEDYGRSPENHADLRTHIDEFKDWTITIPFAKNDAQEEVEHVTIICCPEDRYCDNKNCAKQKQSVCGECQVPLCRDCYKELSKNADELIFTEPIRQAPTRSLANELMTFYAPSSLYQNSMTVMEMICSSVCLTSMICFSLEVKYGHLLDTEVHKQDHRVAARGNATTFLMPWQSLLNELEQRENKNGGSGGNMKLPLVGKDLQSAVQVLLKCGDNQKRKSLPKFVHQAHVRRAVVVEHIRDMKARGHRAYKDVDMTQVERKARELPENGVPKELIRFMEYDKHLDKVLVQKHATPSDAGTNDLQQVAESLSTSIPNAVAMEQSSSTQVDYNNLSAKVLTACEHKSKSRARPDGSRINVSEYFNEDATRDNILLLASSFIEHAEYGRLVLTCKCLYESDNDEAASRLNCALIYGADLSEWKHVVVQTSSDMMKQFEPWYFGVAFAHCFKFCTGMPDAIFHDQRKRHKRKETAKDVPLDMWVHIMTRRCEVALSQAWDLGFCMSSLLFQSALNASRSLHAFENGQTQNSEHRGFSAAEIRAASIEISEKLNGSYKDEHGRWQGVKRDMSKLHRMDLTQGAKRILQRIQNIAQKIPGTNEIRTIMRYNTHAARISQGVPLFLTWSPDEKHNLLYLRLARTRKNDPSNVKNKQKHLSKYGGLYEPPLGEELMAIPIEDLYKKIPTMKERRALLARDALACVDGFRTLVLLCCEHLLGIRCCVDCPNCCCTDLFGSNAEPEGGAIGRIDGIYGAVESQKSSGSLHLHMQVFVQCIHQHMSLREICEQNDGKLKDLYSAYAVYKENVCRQQLEDCDMWKEHKEAVESEWPLYENRTELVSTPDLCHGAKECKNKVKQTPKQWRDRYLRTQVQRIQELRQNHVHIRNDKTGEYIPLTHCQSAQSKRKCKFFFPRETWLVNRTLPLCKGFLKKRKMPNTGKKNLSYTLHGPMNDANMNACLPVLMAGAPGTNFNNDIQLPYRFPITEETHASDLCEERCWQCGNQVDQMILLAQTQQNAQAGYAADYQCKRSASGYNEVKEIRKGHHALSETIADKRLSYIGHRHCTRILSDYYGRGIVRSFQESVNLRAYADKADVTNAESIKTFNTVIMPGAGVVRLLEKFHGGVQENSKPVLTRQDIDMRDVRNIAVVRKDVAYLYAMRPLTEELKYLSLYEFMRYYKLELARYPLYEDEQVYAEEDDKFHASLTEAGIGKLAKRKYGDYTPLNGEADYIIKEQGGQDWLPLPKHTALEKIRHERIIVRNNRPKTPSFCNSPMPKKNEHERNALITLAYFHPFTLQEDLADDYVPHVKNLKGKHANFDHKLEDWLNGNILTLECKHAIQNFFNVCQVRPESIAKLDKNEDDLFSDEELDKVGVQTVSLFETQIGSGRWDPINKGIDEEAYCGEDATSATAGFTLASRIWNRQEAEHIRVNQSKTRHIAGEDDIKRLKKEVLKSRLQDEDATLQPGQREGSVKANGVTEASLREWLQKLGPDAGDKRHNCNHKQKEVVNKVMETVLEQNVRRLKRRKGEEEQLLWLMHGGPGTGKSHVIKVIREELFERQLNWVQGLDFQVGAFQAVNAEQLDGDTLHHALGLNLRKEEKKRQWAQRINQWKWIIIDEISMVSANLLAEIDVHLRKIRSDANEFKKNKDNVDRPFGGINVLFVGDFFQLNPTGGTALNAIPTAYIKKARVHPAGATEERGQHIFWGGAEDCVQGVTELTECKRIEHADAWLLQVQDEFRYGKLSEDTHSFLHGFPTSVPGSWLADGLACKNDSCLQLWDKISKDNALECDICKKERRLRKLVVDESDECRLNDVGVLEATAIYPNNDLKTHVMKQRAAKWATVKKEELTWICADDRAVHSEHQDRAYEAQDKLRWLQKSDKICGGLHGCIPIANGMPVMLQEHLDRSADKQLLKGTIGRIHSWTEDMKERADRGIGQHRTLSHLPRVIFIDFNTDKWSIKGAPGPGIYPIFPTETSWHIDAYRGKSALLAVKRRQYAIAPAFACTAHSAQGKTLEKVIADLEIGRGVSSIASYIAITRIKCRKGLLIYRPFDISPYQQGVAQGTDLLLRSLRGEEIDWNMIENMAIPKRRCRLCGEVKHKHEYHKHEFALKKQEPICEACMQACQRETGEWSFNFCNSCEEIRAHNLFHRIKKQHQSHFRRNHCFECSPQMNTHNQALMEKDSFCCKICGKETQGQDLSSIERRHLRNDERTLVCVNCKQKGKSVKDKEEHTCTRCWKKAGRSYFQGSNLGRAIKRGTVKCLQCQDGTRGGAQCRARDCKIFIEEADLTTVDKEQERNHVFLCKDCSESGTSVGCCSRCYEIGPPQLFTTKDFSRDRNKGVLKCKACASGKKKGEQCAKCRAYIPEDQMTSTQKKSRKRGTICLDCNAEGYSLKNSTTYRCTEPTCKYAGGRGQFQQMNFERDLAHEMVRCIECASKKRHVNK